MSKTIPSHRKASKPELRGKHPEQKHEPGHEPTAPRAPELPELDRLIHERIRLGIVSALATNDSLSFNDLKRVLKTTDGNLSVHARKLEEAGYVKCSKSFEGRMPKTEYRLTEEGSRALTRGRLPPTTFISLSGSVLTAAGLNPLLVRASGPVAISQNVGPSGAYGVVTMPGIPLAGASGG